MPRRNPVLTFLTELGAVPQTHSLKTTEGNNEPGMKMAFLSNTSILDADPGPKDRNSVYQLRKWG